MGLWHRAHPRDSHPSVGWNCSHLPAYSWPPCWGLLRHPTLKSLLCSCLLYRYILYKAFVILGSSSRLDWLINHPSLWGCLGLQVPPLSVVIYWQMSEQTSVTIYPMSWFSQSRDTHTTETPKWEWCQEITNVSWLTQHLAIIHDFGVPIHLSWQLLNILSQTYCN